jgi:DNA-binding LytR/AlgR family response regulator
MKISCIIIDDEPLARRGIREYINDTAFLQLVGEFDTALKAVELINTQAVQLIFLDIQMPRVNGLDFVKSLQHPPPVIFTTAYPQHALAGFDLNALDYLVKPIAFDRFFKAVLKAKEYYEVRLKNKAESSAGDGYFFVKADSRLVKINLDDILFIEALQNYVVIQTKDKKYITYLTFKSVEEYLPPETFIKTHKSYIVSVSRIDSIEGNDLRIGQHYIPISRNEKEEVMEKLLKGKFLKR